MRLFSSLRLSFVDRIKKNKKQKISFYSTQSQLCVAATQDEDKKAVIKRR
jgi:hypothetical protein